MAGCSPRAAKTVSLRDTRLHKPLYPIRGVMFPHAMVE